VNAINRLEKEENVSRTEKGRRKRKKHVKWLQRQLGQIRKIKETFRKQSTSSNTSASVPVTNATPVNPPNCQCPRGHATNQSTANVDRPTQRSMPMPKGPMHHIKTAPMSERLVQRKGNMKVKYLLKKEKQE
jgi:hypothetical protein